MNDLYVKYTGRQLEEIERALDRDTFLEADEAPFGLWTRCSIAPRFGPNRRSRGQRRCA
jgi:hypothetical protein